jgi:stearoyl-CoA desaturase (delta-9 desaturase)
MVRVLVAVAIGLVVSQVALYLTTIYLHRALSHRAVVLSPVATATCRVLTWMLTGIRPRQWVAVHRKHHAHTDKIGDPHSPVLLGYARVQWTNVALYRKVARDPDEVARYARDLPPDRFDRILFDHSLLGLGTGIGFLFVLGGWEIAAIASVVHTVFYLVGNGAINAVGHHWGRRPYDNLATNNQWLAWLVAGEGQQPSRGDHLGPAVTGQGRVRPRLVGGPSDGPFQDGHRPPRRHHPEDPPASARRDLKPAPGRGAGQPTRRQ